MQSQTSLASLLSHEKADANCTTTKTPEGKMTRDHPGINGACQLFSPEVTDARSHGGGHRCVALHGKLKKSPRIFLKGRLIPCKNVADNSELWTPRRPQVLESDPVGARMFQGKSVSWAQVGGEHALWFSDLYPARKESIIVVTKGVGGTGNCAKCTECLH